MRLNRFWTTVLPPAILAVSMVSISACSRSNAQQAAAEPGCKAAVSFVSSAEACPIASLKFHVAVTGCANSSGTFGFTYMKGNANQRINSKGSGAWARNVSEWDQTEKVALNCDQELHTVEVDDPASCTCASP